MLNKVTLIGNLGADPEVRYTDSGTAVANFRIATTETWKDDNGDKQERTEWHRITAWGKMGETCGEFLRKGRQAYIEGRLTTREWTDKEDVKRYTTEVVATKVIFLGSKDGNKPNKPTGKPSGKPTGKPSGKPTGKPSGKPTEPDEPPPIGDDDIPF